METKAGHPANLLEGQTLPPWVRAYYEFCQLKQLYRQGWLRRGIPKERCESVAEHSLGAALLALWLAESSFPELDANKVLRMALVHDFGEIYTGDIIPSDPVSAADKQQRERQSVQQVFAGLPQGAAYLALWEEFETGESAEARFVRQIDRLEMGLQASLYQRQGFPHMDEFLASARAALSDQRLLETLDHGHLTPDN